MNNEMFSICRKCKIEKPIECFVNLYGNRMKRCNACVLATRRIAYERKLGGNFREFLPEEFHISDVKKVEAYTGYLFMEAIA